MPYSKPPKPPGSAGIYIGPGSTNIRTSGNIIRGYNHGIVDLGNNNSHKNNDIVTAEKAQPPAEKGEDVSIVSTPIALQETGETWDVFVSHASEDKDFVKPLATALQENGLHVWYDEFSLKLGDSLRRSIDKGLAHCRFGIVVLSPAFFSKEWPARELDGLVAREISGKKVILPIWHNVSSKDILAQSPTLADRIGVKSSSTMSELVNAIKNAIV